jgi:DNA-binding transcriptional regulator YiaG
METRTNEDFRQCLRDLDVSQRKFADEIDTDYSAVNRWALGKAKVPGAVWAYLRLKFEIRELAKKAGMR